MMACWTLAGCDRAGYAGKPTSSQERPGNVADWDRAATRVAQAMQDRGLFAVVPGQPQRSFFVYNTVPGSAFLKEVGQALQTEIIQRGGGVALTADAPITINLAVDIVQWSGDVPGTRLSEASWSATILGPQAIAMRYRDHLYVREADAIHYASASTLAPIGANGPVPTSAMQPVRFAR